MKQMHSMHWIFFLCSLSFVANGLVIDDNAVNNVAENNDVADNIVTKNVVPNNEDIVGQLRQATSSPTVPPMPTSSPTESPMPRGFYNYNPYSKFGPKKWDDVDTEDSEFSKLFKGDKQKNKCDGNRQSPINVKSHAACHLDHQTFTKRGTYKANFDTIDFTILPNCLRANLYVPKNELDGPKIDTSNLAEWKAATYVDVKLPAEHLFKGKRYIGEFQIFHHWDKDGGRMVALSVLMDDDDDEEHIQLEQFLREWEEVAWKKENECARKYGINVPAYNRTYTRPSYEEKLEIWGAKCGKHSCKPHEHADYDLYKFLTTFWFCTYKGSLTVPPCTESVWWYVYDLPMKISKDQHVRLKRLLFQQLDDDCNRASVAYDRGVNRPLQRNRNKSNMKCCRGNNFKARVDHMGPWRKKWPRKYHGRNAMIYN